MSELAALQQGLHWADGLTDEQEAAIQAAEKNDLETARKIVFGDEYGRELDRVAAQIGKFQYMLDQRTENTVRQATEGARQWRFMSEIMLGATALLFLCVLYFILKQRILRPVVRLSDVVTRLAAQDFAAVPPDFPRWMKLATWPRPSASSGKTAWKGKGWSRNGMRTGSRETSFRA